MDASVPAVTAPSFGRFVLRVAWISARILLAFYLGHADVFFYQGF
jgi:predicted secreted protein